MALAPEPYLSACLATLREAILIGRALGWGPSTPGQQVADLMDAVHNIPDLIQHWESCDLASLRASLMAYDARWAVNRSALCAAFDAAGLAGQGT